MRLPSSDPKSIHLDAVDCCALWHAVLLHPIAAAKWRAYGSRFALIQNILFNSLSLSFVPTDEVAAMYRSAAESELKRLQGPRAGLKCRHSLDEHVQALHGIVVRFPMPSLN